MAQHDYNIANQTAANARTDINNVLSAIATNNSGTAAPSTTFANQWWYDTDAFILYIRANGNDAWIPVAYLDQTNDKFRILDDTQVVNTSGTQTGLLGDQATATWETGTGTIESLVSPAKLKAGADKSVESKLNISGTAPIYGVRAWADWNGTGSAASNQTIRASGNIASVYKNYDANYTVTFSTAMPDANYAVSYTGGGTVADDGTQANANVYSKSAGSFSFDVTDATGNNYFQATNNMITIVR